MVQALVQEITLSSPSRGHGEGVQVFERSKVVFTVCVSCVSRVCLVCVSCVPCVCPVCVPCVSRVVYTFVGSGSSAESIRQV